MEKIINPFLIKGYAGKELFCDREQELDILYKNVCMELIQHLYPLEE